ncbi:MAG: hypothetical protein KA105_02705 [Caulobacter sp.]|nr:hypothetical protein [Caulobacter sp.]
MSIRVLALVAVAAAGLSACARSQSEIDDAQLWASVDQAYLVRICADGSWVGRDRKGRLVAVGRSRRAAYVAPDVRVEDVCILSGVVEEGEVIPVLRA